MNAKGTHQINSSGSRELNVGSDHDQTTSIAVPSRLREGASIGSPLKGLRIAIKDIFTIRGIKTSVCNRAFYELYPPAKETAGCIERLIQRGATLVGTTKLASFAATEEPLECIDFQAPWNPRADGYQSPAGSSSGSGVAIASYPWLDIALGSDSMFSHDRTSTSTYFLFKLAVVGGGQGIGMGVMLCDLRMIYYQSTATFQVSGKIMDEPFLSKI